MCKISLGNKYIIIGKHGFFPLNAVLLLTPLEIPGKELKHQRSPYKRLKVIL